MNTVRTRLGLHGQEIAKARLEANGMRFIRKNYSCPAGELDLIMLDGREIVFVEVKTRRTEIDGAAEESVGATKSRRLLAAARTYLAAANAPDLVWRIDLIAITLQEDGRVGRFTHIENAIVTG